MTPTSRASESQSDKNVSGVSPHSPGPDDGKNKPRIPLLRSLTGNASRAKTRNVGESKLSERKLGELQSARQIFLTDMHKELLRMILNFGNFIDENQSAMEVAGTLPFFKQLRELLLLVHTCTAACYKDGDDERTRGRNLQRLEKRLQQVAELCRPAVPAWPQSAGTPLWGDPTILSTYKEQAQGAFSTWAQAASDFATMTQAQFADSTRRSNPTQKISAVSYGPLLNEVQSLQADFNYVLQELMGMNSFISANDYECSIQSGIGAATHLAAAAASGSGTAENVGRMRMCLKKATKEIVNFEKYLASLLDSRFSFEVEAVLNTLHGLAKAILDKLPKTIARSEQLLIKATSLLTSHGEAGQGRSGSDLNAMLSPRVPRIAKRPKEVPDASTGPGSPLEKNADGATARVARSGRHSGRHGSLRKSRAVRRNLVPKPDRNQPAPDSNVIITDAKIAEALKLANRAGKSRKRNNEDLAVARESAQLFKDFSPPEWAATGARKGRGVGNPADPGNASRLSVLYELLRIHHTVVTLHAQGPAVPRFGTPNADHIAINEKLTEIMQYLATAAESLGSVESADLVRVIQCLRRAQKQMTDADAILCAKTWRVLAGSPGDAETEFLMLTESWAKDEANLAPDFPFDLTHVAALQSALNKVHALLEKTGEILACAHASQGNPVSLRSFSESGFTGSPQPRREVPRSITKMLAPGRRERSGSTDANGSDRNMNAVAANGVAKSYSNIKGRLEVLELVFGSFTKLPSLDYYQVAVACAKKTLQDFTVPIEFTNTPGTHALLVAIIKSRKGLDRLKAELGELNEKLEKDGNDPERLAKHESFLKDIDAIRNVMSDLESAADTIYRGMLESEKSLAAQVSPRSRGNAYADAMPSPRNPSGLRLRPMLTRTSAAVAPGPGLPDAPLRRSMTAPGARQTKGAANIPSVAGNPPVATPVPATSSSSPEYSDDSSSGKKSEEQALAD